MDKDQYDQAATVFSPDGRVYQVEYAREAIKRGGLAMAMVFKDGILFSIDKSIYSPLMEEDHIEKFFKITDRIGAAASGLIADARVLVDILREKAQEEKLQYGIDPDLRTLAIWISRIYEVYTRYEGVRPFGTALIIGGMDGSGFKVYETDPSGVFQERRATAIGRASKTALTILEADHRSDMTRDEALDLVFKVLKETFAERPQEVPKGEEFHVLTAKGLEDITSSKELERFQELLKELSKGATLPKTEG
jgi:proteasome alpha subunit